MHLKNFLLYSVDLVRLLRERELLGEVVLNWKMNTWDKLKNSDKKKGPNLVCGSDKIEISFEMAELDAMKLGTENLSWY